LLPSPSEQSTPDGGKELRWQTSIAPDEGVIAYYSCHFIDPQTIYYPDRIILPFATLQAKGTITENELELHYTLLNTSSTTLRNVSVSVFLPTQVVRGKDKLVKLYNIKKYETVPNASDVIEESGEMDGFLKMATGHDFYFTIPEIASEGSEEITINCQIARTGSHGDVAPYLILGYNCMDNVIEPMKVTIISPPDINTNVLPSAYISNVGFPDIIRFSF
jgi:hypothetical protein